MHWSMVLHCCDVDCQRMCGGKRVLDGIAHGEAGDRFLVRHSFGMLSQMPSPFEIQLWKKRFDVREKKRGRSGGGKCSEAVPRHRLRFEGRQPRSVQQPSIPTGVPYLHICYNNSSCLPYGAPFKGQSSLYSTVGSNQLTVLTVLHLKDGRNCTWKMTRKEGRS